MTMARTCFMLALAAAANVVYALPSHATAAAAPIGDNVDVVLAPPSDKDISLPEALLIYVPGGKVPATYYTNTVAAIQNASNLRLWAVVPSFPSMLCIETCATAATCTLHNTLSTTLDTARSYGYTGPESGANVFVAGHSLGGVCADALVKKFAGTDKAYGALIEMGSFVAGKNVGDYATPVFTIGGELDGGSARPSVTYESLVSADEATAKAGYPLDGAFQMTTKPVVVLPSIDHSSFCPGFHVPGDIWPAEASFAEGSVTIGKAIGAFLDLNTQEQQTPAVVGAAMDTLHSAVSWTRSLLQGYAAASAMEKMDTSTTAPDASWCRIVQERISNLSPSDWQRVHIDEAIYLDKILQFEHSRVGSTVSGDQVVINISGHNGAYPATDLKDGCVPSAREIGCKLLSGARLAKLLGTTTVGDDISCGQVNKYAIQQAEVALGTTPVGRKTLNRFYQKGRPILLSPDKIQEIGPLFIGGHMGIADCVGAQCLNVSSVRLGPLPLDAPQFAGVQYCKVLSPAKVVDYIMTDALKPISTCQNKDPSP